MNEKLTSRPITYVAGYVTDSLTGAPIADQAVPVGEDGATYYTNYAGRFFICAPGGEPLPLSVTHPEFFPYERTFAIPPWENRSAYRLDLMLRREEPPLTTALDPPIAPAIPPKEEVPPVVESPAEPETPPDTILRKARVVKRNLTVRFSFDDATLTAAQITNIEAFAESVRNKNIISISIKGYADDIGTENHNLQLSQKRAKAVGVHLAGVGVRANEVSIKGLGELAGSSQRALNRKVEVTVRYRELVEIR